MSKKLKDRRKKVESYILESIGKIDKENRDYYKKFFDSLSDTQFNTFMKALKDRKTSIHIYIPNLKKTITNQDIFNLAKQFNITYYDQLRLKSPQTGIDFYTKFKLLLLKLPVRRVKQYLFGKIRLPESDKHISKLSGQPMKPDKGSKISLIETYILSSKGFEQSLLELIKLRGGDINGYYQLKNRILQNGIAYTSDIDTDKSKPKSVTIMESYLKALHIDINLGG